MRIEILLLVFGFSCVGWGQRSLHQFHQLSKENGLAAGTNNNYIFVDSKRNVWISSIAGLHRYDGHRIRQYHQGDQFGDLISEVASESNFGEDKRGKIWFALGKAYSSYDYKTDDFSHFKVRKNNKVVSSHYNWSWLDPRDDKLYFGAGRDLYVTDTKEPDAYNLLDSIRVNFKARMIALEGGGVRLLRILPDSKTLAFTDYLDGERVGGYRSYELPSGATINDALSVSDYEIIVASSLGLFAFSVSDSVWTKYGSPEVEQNLGLIELERFGDTLYIGSRQSGIYLFDVETRKYNGGLFRVGEQMVERFKPNLVRLYISQDGLLWVSTDGQGVSYTDLKKSKLSYLKPPRDSSSGVIGMILDDQDNLITLYFDHYTINQFGELTQYPIPIDNRSEFDEPTFINIDRKGRLFIGTYDRLYVADSIGAKLTPIHLVPESSYRLGYGYNSMEQLPDGELVFCINDSVPIIVDEDLSRSSIYLSGVQRPRKILLDGIGNGLVLTFLDTLHVFDEKTKMVDTFFTNLPLVTDGVYDSLRNVFWLGTLNGLYTLQRSKNLWTISRETVIKDGAVMSVELSDENDLWLAGSEGIQCFKIGNRKVQHYLLSDGIQGFEFGLDSKAFSRNGTLYFGGRNGVTFFQPSVIHPTVREPSLSVVNYKVNDKEVPKSKLFHLEYDRNDITFELANGDLSDPLQNKYFYRLGGSFRPEKIRVPSATLRFTNLSEGEYELELWSENSDGVSTFKPLLIPFTILPPWYRTWWAYTLYALAIATIVFAFFWIRLLGIRKLEKEQLRTAQSDARAAEHEARAAETETSVLRLQMNPHFIFNSLNSVNSFIETGKTLEAQDYLYKFADLIRDILRRSEQPLTRLDQAIQLLTDYLEAEQMRMGDRLDFVIEEDEELDTFSTYLPTMIIQPFVENAIWHGIGGREEGGRVTLRFGTSPAGDQLLVEIEDNGVGREATAKSGKKHASKALSITRRRLDLLNNTTLAAPATAPENASAVNTKPAARFEVQDLQHPDGTSAGTRILLYLPLNYEPADESNHN